MKKNTIGHMASPARSTGRRLKRLHILPKLLCLLLALSMWLLITNLDENKEFKPLFGSTYSENAN